jgi:hypothetical protein
MVNQIKIRVGIIRNLQKRVTDKTIIIKDFEF